MCGAGRGARGCWGWRVFPFPFFFPSPASCVCSVSLSFSEIVAVVGFNSFDSYLPGGLDGWVKSLELTCGVQGDGWSAAG